MTEDQAMENLKLSKTASGVHVDGYPKAEKVIRITGKLAERLADMHLHLEDLEFANACLDEINQAPQDSRVVRQALWRSAIVHYAKCFGRSAARKCLTVGPVYRGLDKAPEAFNYFIDLRRKHVVHDENAYARAIPGAIVNPIGSARKIERVTCFALIAETLDQSHYGTLKLLIQTAIEYVKRQIDELPDRILSDLEQLPHETLLAMEALSFDVPLPIAIGLTR